MLRFDRYIPPTASVGMLTLTLVPIVVRSVATRLLLVRRMRFTTMQLIRLGAILECLTVVPTVKLLRLVVEKFPSELSR